jgi:hypothetical protein
MKAAGKTSLVIGQCCNQDRQGACLGHEDTDE